MSITANNDLFSMANVKGEAAAPAGTPGLSFSQVKKGGVDLSQYAIRVQRFELSDDGDDIMMLESLLSRCVNPKDDSAWLLERKDHFAPSGAFICIIFYLERRPS